MMGVGQDVFRREGIRGLYRGGLPLVMGGGLMRSAQFGVSTAAMDVMKNQLQLPDYSIAGIVSYQVVLAGIAGGLGRGLVEAPTDFFKVRRQVERGSSASDMLKGVQVTLVRNTFLYSSFVVYMDLSRQMCTQGYIPQVLTVPDGSQLTPFAKGAICANMAWLTVWPGDVIKTQRQSGNFEGWTAGKLFRWNMANGTMFKGVVPGLARSTIANGCGMVVYEYVVLWLNQIK
jgi:solute carrier family 25 carnitine/acylcarnitine transporter 20/29